MTRPSLASSPGSSADAFSSPIRRTPLTAAPSNRNTPRDEADDDDDAYLDDSLPSIREIVASLASAEHAHTKSTGKQRQRGSTGSED